MTRSLRGNDEDPAGHEGCSQTLGVFVIARLADTELERNVC